MAKAKDVDKELVKAFEVVRRKLQNALNKSVAKDIEIKRLKVELAIAREDIESTIVVVRPVHPPRSHK